MFRPRALHAPSPEPKDSSGLVRRAEDTAELERVGGREREEEEGGGEGPGRREETKGWEGAPHLAPLRRQRPEVTWERPPPTLWPVLLAPTLQKFGGYCPLPPAASSWRISATAGIWGGSQTGPNNSSSSEAARTAEAPCSRTGRKKGL